MGVWVIGLAIHNANIVEAFHPHEAELYDKTETRLLLMM
jgi:hypothetical protein